MTRHGSHTESRMRENCAYGSMRGIRRKTAKHVLRVAEGRAGVPHGASRSTLHPSRSLLDLVVGQEVMIDSRGLKWYNGGV